MPYLYVYSPSDFVGGLPNEASAVAAGGSSQSLTLAPGATPTLIKVDDNEIIFDEVDGTQSLMRAETIDGTSFAAGTTINTAYDLINATTGHKMTSFHFGGDGYQQGAVDGIVSTVPLVPGQTYTFDINRTSHQKDNFYEDYVACFVAGTLIDTPNGPRRIETLGPGDLVRTQDDGAQPVLWSGTRRVPGDGCHAPVRLPFGWNGLEADLEVSPMHRMYLESAWAEMFFGLKGGLVSAAHLLRAGIGRTAPRGSVAYHHIMLEKHQLVRAAGALSETLFAPDFALYGNAPCLAEGLPTIQTPVRPILRGFEAELMLAPPRVSSPTASVPA